MRRRRFSLSLALVPALLGSVLAAQNAQSPVHHSVFASLPQDRAPSDPLPSIRWPAFFDALDPSDPSDIERAFSRVAMETTIADETLAHYLAFLDAAAQAPRPFKLYPAQLSVNTAHDPPPSGLLAAPPAPIDWKTLDRALHVQCSRNAATFLSTMADHAPIARNGSLMISWAALGDHALTLSRLVENTPVTSPFYDRFARAYDEARRIYLGGEPLPLSPCADASGRLDPELLASYAAIASETQANDLTNEVAARLASFE